MKDIWQHKDFPNFTFDKEVLSSLIQEFAIELGVIDDIGAFVKEGGGRSVSYQLNFY